MGSNLGTRGYPYISRQPWCIECRMEPTRGAQGPGHLAVASSYPFSCINLVFTERNGLLHPWFANCRKDLNSNPTCYGPRNQSITLSIHALVGTIFSTLIPPGSIDWIWEKSAQTSSGVPEEVNKGAELHNDIV